MSIEEFADEGAKLWEWAMDCGIDDRLDAARRGDRLATARLHARLAERLRAGELSAHMVDVLASMHEAIANGTPADIAMLTKQTGRPNNRTRDENLFEFIDARVSSVELALALARKWPDKFVGEKTPAPEMNAWYAAAAEKFGVSAKTAKNIYLRERNRIKAQ